MRADWDQLEGRNIVIEALRREVRDVHVIFLDQKAKPDRKVQEIVHTASKRGIRLKRTGRQHLDKMSLTGVHNGVIAHADSLRGWTTKSLLNEVMGRGDDPFFVLADELQYEHNLGAILRSAMGAGVNGVIVPVKRGKGLTAVVQRVSMGGAEVVPFVREGLSSSLAQLKRAGLRIVGADMRGEPHWSVDLKGPIAIVLGGESKGLSPTIRKRCDAIASIPLNDGLDSLNVSVSAGILMFEKLRQERLS